MTNGNVGAKGTKTAISQFLSRLKSVPRMVWLSLILTIFVFIVLIIYVLNIDDDKPSYVQDKPNSESALIIEKTTNNNTNSLNEALAKARSVKTEDKSVNKEELEALKEQIKQLQEQLTQVQNQPQPKPQQVVLSSNANKTATISKLNPEYVARLRSGSGNPNYVKIDTKSGTNQVSDPIQVSTNPVTYRGVRGEFASSLDKGTGKFVAVDKQGNTEELNPYDIKNFNSEQKLDLSFVVPMDTYIPCTLNNDVLTSFSGSLSCMISEDIYSYDMTKILIPRGSVAYADYNVGAIAGGESKLFFVFNKIRLPNNSLNRILDIKLNSPVTSELGVVGADGVKNTYFWRRFGSALAVGILGDTTVALNNRLNGTQQQQPNLTLTNSTYNAGAYRPQDYSANTRQAISSVLTSLIKDYDIKPTISLTHGQEIGLVLNSDLYLKSLFKR